MNKHSHLILAVGDPYRSKDILEKKLAQLIPNSDSNSLRRFYAKDADWNEILETARTFPFLSEKQVIWIKQAELMDEDDINLLDAYFSNPAPFTWFFFEADSLKDKKRLRNWIEKKNGEMFLFESEKGGRGQKNRSDESRSFIREKMKTLKIQAAPGAIKMLEQSCGNHFLFLDHVLEKLSLKIGPGETFTEKDVEMLTEEMEDSTGFDLAEALASKKISRVMEIYFSLYEGDPYQGPAELMGLLNWQIRRMYEAKRLLKRGASRQEISSKVRMSPYFFDRFMSQVNTFDEKKLEESFHLLFRTDQAVKTGKASVSASLEMLLLRLGLS